MAKVGGAGTPFFMIGRTSDPIYDLTPILAGAPPNTYDVIERAVERVEAGKPGGTRTRAAGSGERWTAHDGPREPAGSRAIQITAAIVFAALIVVVAVRAHSGRASSTRSGHTGWHGGP